MKPFLLGLTGSIGMGKSTTAAMFTAAGVPVWDADATVHRLYAPGGAAIPAINSLHPAAIQANTVDRAALKAWIAADPTALAKIEAAVHPLVAADRARFIATANAESLIVLDIPLLFETGADALLDATLVVTAPATVQKARVLARPGMTEPLFQALLAKQLPDAEKRSRATYVIETRDLASTEAEVNTLIQQLRKLPHA